jgi:5-(carboxyamino)imidazole ribonucleotide synthase
VIVPPATLGILGGGQLGRYTVLAAHTMGYRTMVLEPDPGAPAGRVADVHLVAAYDDPAALDRLAAECAVVTTEFENPPAATLDRLIAHTVVRPSPQAIAVAQDRAAEKAFLRHIGAPTAPFLPIGSAAEVAAAADATYPAILKTNRLGYDGKGQVAVANHAELTAAWDRLGRVPCVLEQRLALDLEISVLVARTADGQSIVYPVAENEHVDGILDTTVVPAAVPSGVHDEAVALATTIATELGFVGLLAVEMFVVHGHVLVNELAPRPHNSGHWTLDACLTDQFEQHVRAVCGLALGPTTLNTPAVAMVNLLGDLWEHGEPDWAAVLAEPAATLHLYGKREPRPGRKMGHITVTGTHRAEVVTLAQRLRDRLAPDRHR